LIPSEGKDSGLDLRWLRIGNQIGSQMLCALSPNAAIKDFLIGFREPGSQFINCHLFLFTARERSRNTEGLTEGGAITKGASSHAKKTPAPHPRTPKGGKDAPVPENKAISLGVASSKIASPNSFFAYSLRSGVEQLGTSAGNRSRSRICE
jgi:hypothetical protein